MASKATGDGSPIPAHRGFHLVEVLGPSGVGKSTALAMMRAMHPTAAVSRADLDPVAPGKPQSQLDTPALQPALELVFHILARATGPLSYRMAALDMCRASFEARMQLDRPTAPQTRRLRGRTLIHDELALHRAFSVLPFSSNRLRDARAFFSAAPLPDRAVICIADPRHILSRIAARGPLPNCYRGLGIAAQEDLLQDLVDCSLIAHDCLTRRGTDCRLLRLDGDLASAAGALAAACLEHPAVGAMA